MSPPELVPSVCPSLPPSNPLLVPPNSRDAAAALLARVQLLDAGHRLAGAGREPAGEGGCRAGCGDTKPSGWWCQPLFSAPPTPPRLPVFSPRPSPPASSSRASCSRRKVLDCRGAARSSRFSCSILYTSESSSKRLMAGSGPGLGGTTPWGRDLGGAPGTRIGRAAPAARTCPSLPKNPPTPRPASQVR